MSRHESEEKPFEILLNLPTSQLAFCEPKGQIRTNSYHFLF